jgi:hypothetical protein
VPIDFLPIILDCVSFKSSHGNKIEMGNQTYDLLGLKSAHEIVSGLFWNCMFSALRKLTVYKY